MAKDGRSGRLRCSLGCVLGGISGILCVFLIGLIDAPVVNPAAPLAHEWYAPFTSFMPTFYGLLIGAMIGLCTGLECEGAGGEAMGWGYAGLLVGLIAIKILPASQTGKSHFISHLVLIAVSACCGLLIARRSRVRRSRQTDEIKEMK